MHFFATLHLSYALAYPLLDSNTTQEEIKGDIKTHTLQSVVTTATGKEHLQKRCTSFNYHNHTRRDRI
ncbi:MAG: hypothetical protein SPJ16_04340 [Helicobacter sp.]|uniref:hypothetical protein n=1 Tax=Helicobacter sp. TaxID=218 RepID=UPI002A9135C4|nr:hypothetical protein [Helicobacter sp.]MDY5950406.1 hypothetical protein [Helicobacter sp.]